MAIHIPSNVQSFDVPVTADAVRLSPNSDHGQRRSLNRQKEQQQNATDPVLQSTMEVQSRFQHKDEISEHLIRTDIKLQDWLVQMADVVCEETLVGLLSAKTADAAYLIFGKAANHVQQNLWLKVSRIDGFCSEEVQLHWVKDTCVNLSRYWTSVLRYAGGSTLSAEQQKEFSRLIDEAHRNIQVEANEAGKNFMSTNHTTTIEELIANGAAATVSFPEVEMTIAEQEAIMRAATPQIDNEEAPFPTIDPSMIPEAEDVGIIGKIKQVISAKIEKIKTAVFDSRFGFELTLPIWKVVATMAAAVVILFLVVFFRRSTNAVGISGTGVMSAVRHGFEAIKNSIMSAASTVKSWFSSSATVLTEQPATPMFA
jgi:hypothetical protein